MDQATVTRALEWIREAGELTLGHFRSAELSIDTKGDGSPVTVADRDAEALLRTRIRDAHPADSVLGEEQDYHAGRSDRVWVIDPIDGTRAFSRGVATYSNLLALTDEDGIGFGVITSPRSARRSGR